MSLLKEVILQLFFALTPFVLYNIYYRDKLQNYSRTFILITSSISLFLAMTFASSVVDGIIFDIRYVILFFGLVYGGMQTALILVLEFVLYRCYLGGEGMGVALLMLVCTFLLSVVIYKLYQKTHRKTLYTFLAGILFSLVALGLTYLFFPAYVKQHLAYHVFVIPFQNSVGIWLLMSLFSKAIADKELFIIHAQNEKIQAMSHVAASLAHEVRNPLTAVKGFLRLMQEGPNEPYKTEQYIKISLDEIQRTESILTEYLSISKPLQERHEPINVSEQLHVIQEVMLPFANMHNVELDVQIFDTPVTIIANPDEIKQVLVNFVKNSIEACADVPNGRVMLSILIEKGNAILLIGDNGIGMDEGQIQRLGSIYFSTKSSGTGLGLTYSYHVIHSIGGTIQVTSEPFIGTKFTITFPCLAQEKVEANLTA
ncbi:sporulation kinase [Brevibacillus reuszeri]|uniref:histidine kinase n=1 Tax=Brevibacillus reuszeri TaxID=54915 RepID=A0A0K9YMR9_9BACL|nr:sensor histidine kinase [Brevibacillus reuszeri]KNB69966.1 histidine kinase [Brevibacillus reuszeri]MED1858333.1 ATP-binding protein [Brevibacillus reuszeri]GED68669.1 sporulation kinase [Brevibacillus reuszeri]